MCIRDSLPHSCTAFLLSTLSGHIFPQLDFLDCANVNAPPMPTTGCVPSLPRLSAAAAAADTARLVLNDGERKKLNDGADSFFYNYPRLCYHVDQGFLTHLTDLYRWGWVECGFNSIKERFFSPGSRRSISFFFTAGL